MNTRTRTATTLAIAFGATTSALAANPGPRTWCDASMVAGTYGIQMYGHRPAPGGTETVIGVVIRQYDGLGGVEQWDNIKGEVTGYTPNRYGVGAYLNSDCTVDIEFHPAPGATILERGVIVDDGAEIRTATLVPAGVMVTATHMRI